MKTVDFSETIAPRDLKGNKSRHLIEYMNIQKCKLDFVRNYCADLNQILYESFQVEGNENLLTWRWSHDQDGHHALIW